MIFPNPWAPHMLPQLKPGLVLYSPGDAKSEVMRDFAADLTARGWRVGGVALVTLREGNRRLGLDLLELDTGERAPMARPGEAGTRVGDWMLMPDALARAQAAVSRAAKSNCDLILVDKFGPLEGRGGGLHAAIQQALASRQPLLVALRSEFLRDWDRHCDQPCQLMRPKMQELWRWWGAHRAVTELVRGVPAVPAQAITIGLNWTLVEGPDGVGLAATPAKGSAGCRTLPASNSLTGRPLSELAAMIDSDNGFERVIAMAAINAGYNRQDLTGLSGNGLDLSAPAGEGRTLVVGRFPDLARKLPDALVLERDPGPEDLPAEMASRVIPGCARLIITSSAFTNGTMAELLNLVEGAEVTIVGPGTPLAPALHSYGVKHLAGLVVEDRAGLAQALAQGAGARPLKKFGRSVVLSDDR